MRVKKHCLNCKKEMFCNTKKKYCRNRCRQKAYYKRKSDIKELGLTDKKTLQPAKLTKGQIQGKILGLIIKEALKKADIL